MILGGYLVESNHRTFCQFFIQDSSPSTFFDCNEVIGLQPHGYFYCHGIQASVIAYYHFFLLEIDLLRDLHPRTMLNIASIKGLPYPCAHFTFIYRFNEQSLTVAIRHFYPIPGTPSTELCRIERQGFGIVGKLIQFTLCGITPTVLMQYFGLYTYFGRKKHYLQH